MTLPPSGEDGPVGAKQQLTIPGNVPADASIRGVGHAAGAAVPATIRSEDLLQGRGEVHILHNGDRYRLTVTRAGKLLLQK